MNWLEFGKKSPETSFSWEDVTFAVDTARVFAEPIRVNGAGFSIQDQLLQKLNQWNSRVLELQTIVSHPEPDFSQSLDRSVIKVGGDTVYTKDRDAYYNILLYGRSRVNKLPIDHPDVLQGAYEDLSYVDALASRALSYGADGVIYQMRFFEAVRADDTRSDASIPGMYWYGSMGIEQYVKTMLADPNPSDIDLASIGLTKEMYAHLIWSDFDVVYFVLQPWVQGNVLCKSYVE